MNHLGGDIDPDAERFVAARVLIASDGWDVRCIEDTTDEGPIMPKDKGPISHVSIPIYDPAETMPLANQVVIVNGGIAEWTGEKWLSCIDERKYIAWPVKWWTPLLHDDILENKEALAT